MTLRKLIEERRRVRIMNIIVAAAMCPQEFNLAKRGDVVHCA